MASLLIEPYSEFFTILIQSEDDPFEYYIGLDWINSGLYYIYARFNGTDAPIFPIEI